MFLYYNGSAKRYRLALKDNPLIPRHKIYSLNVYRKALSEFKNDIYFNSDWQSSLSAAMATFKATVTGRKLSGYIQNIERDGHLQITIFSEKQLECLYKTPYNSRICHIDATGCQIKIKKNHLQINDLCAFNRILNYYVLVKNHNLINQDDQTSFQLAELVSSTHDVSTLSVFFLRLKWLLNKTLTFVSS